MAQRQKKFILIHLKSFHSMMIRVSGSFHLVALQFLTCDSKVIWIKEERAWEITHEKLPFIYSFSTGYSLVTEFHLIAKEAEKM